MLCAEISAHFWTEDSVPDLSNGKQFRNKRLVAEEMSGLCSWVLMLSNFLGDVAFMPNEPHQADSEPEKTRPPESALRYETPSELYVAMPQVRQLTQHRPRENEDGMEFLARLRSSTTPEESVTYTAFAAQPKMAIWWGYECLRMSSEDLIPDDRELMELIANWTTYPDAENRFRVMKHALWAPNRTPAVLLGLAAGWSGGPMAPNDPAPVPVSRAPKAINSAVLSSLAKVDLSQRPIQLARFIDLAVSLFRVF